MIFGNEIGDGLFLWIESDRRIDHRLRVVIGLAAWDQHLHVQFLGCCLIFLPTFRYGQRRPKKRAQLLLARSQEFFDLCGCWHDGQPCDSRATEQCDELAPPCMTRKEHTERWRGSVHETASVATGSPQPLWTLVRE